MLRLSPVIHKFNDEACEFGELNGYRIAITIPEKDSAGTNTSLTLSDISHLSRAGFRGVTSSERLQQSGHAVPEINQITTNGQGLLIARFSQTEMMIMQDIEGSSEAYESFIKNVDLSPISEKHPDVYYLPRQDSHACFLLKGDSCSELFSKLCAVDLRTDHFANLHIAQTSMARVGVIILRRDLGTTPAFMLLVDSAAAEYLWDCLEDAGQELSMNRTLFNDGS